MILDNAEKVEKARIEFDTGCENGTIQLKTSNERLIEVANGNSDNQAFIAARNVLEKKELIGNLKYHQRVKGLFRKGKLSQRWED
jgi:hypothetical protein